MQLVALGFLIAGPAGERSCRARLAIGIVLLWIAAILTLYTGWDYMKASYDHVGAMSAMKAVYFAWVRERIGKARKRSSRRRGGDGRRPHRLAVSRGDENYAHAFEKPDVIRAAIDRAHVSR